MAAAAVLTGRTAYAGETLSGSRGSLQFWIAKYYKHSKVIHIFVKYSRRPAAGDTEQIFLQRTQAFK